VFGSHAHPCQGQITLPASTTPSPRGPPRCRQMLSIALISPFTFATQIILPPQENSLASLRAGSSDSEVSLVNMNLQLAPALKIIFCEIVAGSNRRLRLSPEPTGVYSRSRVHRLATHTAVSGGRTAVLTNSRHP